MSVQLDQALKSAIAHHQSGRLAEAERIYRRILAAQPRHSEALHLLGLIAHQTGQREIAAEQIARAILLDPSNPVAHLNLGEVYRALKRWDEARESYERALALRPDYAEAHNNLGLLLQTQGFLQEACARYERALALRPDFAEACNNLARALKESGRIEEAVRCYRLASDLRPGDAQMHSNLVFALQFQPGLDVKSLEQEHRRWNERHALPLRSRFRPQTNSRDPERRLRVGYVSADFRQHPISFFLYPLLREHNPKTLEVYAYASVKQPDAITAGLKNYTACWRNALSLTDADLAAQIRADRIDILVDLSMHAANSRLRVFAERPAPVQVSWLGYPGTTGLETIDYRLSDIHMDPPAEFPGPSLGGEPVRLSDSWCCFHPLGETPAVTDLPALRRESNRIVTFGCLNNFSKVNQAVLSRWARVLAAVPESRLLLHCPNDDGTHRHVCSLLAAHGGVSRERIEFIPPQGRRGYLQTYGRIDVGLDPFPFNGMTTTCDALWMGVPVLAQPGSTPGSRVGTSLLTSVGLPELVAKTEEEYITLAAALARDLPRLARLRATLRARMESSPLMNAPRFARHVEQAYGFVWQRWCHGQPPAGIDVVPERGGGGNRTLE